MESVHSPETGGSHAVTLDEGNVVRRVLTVFVLSCLVTAMLVVPATALIDTDTTGRFCCTYPGTNQIENYGLYTFKGKTTPSMAGQIVKFQYKRESWDTWRPFKVGTGGSDGNGFYALNKSRPRDRIDEEHRWSVQVVPSVRQGNYRVRAVFPRQDGYGRSVYVTRKMWVWQSD